MVNATDSRGHIVNKYFHIIPHWKKISCLSRASSSPHILLPRFMGIVVFRVHPKKKENWELLFTFKTIYCVTVPPTDTVLQLNPYTDQPKHYDHLLVSLLPPKQIWPVDAQTPLCSVSIRTSSLAYSSSSVGSDHTGQPSLHTCINDSWPSMTLSPVHNFSSDTYWPLQTGVEMFWPSCLAITVWPFVKVTQILTIAHFSCF